MESSGGESSSMSAAEKAKDRMERLHKLHLLRTTARKLNHAEVVAEDARNKLPANFEARQRQADWLAANEKGRAEAAAKGLDYDRIKLLNVSAVEAANNEKKKRKKNPDPGFTDYETLTARQYNRLVKQFPEPDMDKYQNKRQQVGDEIFYGGAHTISQGTHKDTPQAINNMVNDLEQQIMKRKSFSRRRTHNDDADIDYINEKNARFNKKLERFYGEHTAEIKQNLERGTAI
ncbi:pre-mRNA-splicing factor Syf2 [Sitodiplosis mosellana]|uniref:pre-mRNA-splicing factor Syf2 n=1 Tax=Sitodiplosis mosellana TaxID=263140 RepID=UPI0024443C47|nr:pre-mRNA-splicing factor Syf2 [Sitodiplosis mosellana]